MGCSETNPPRSSDSGGKDQHLERVTDLPPLRDQGAADASPLARALELELPAGHEANSGRAAIAFDGEHFVVVWEVLPPGAKERELWTARISEDGQLLSPPTSLEQRLGYTMARKKLFCSSTNRNCGLWYYYTGASGYLLCSLKFEYDAPDIKDSSCTIKIQKNIRRNFDVARWRGHYWILAAEDGTGLQLYKTAGDQIDVQGTPVTIADTSANHPVLCAPQPHETESSQLYMLWRKSTHHHAVLAEPDLPPSENAALSIISPQNLQNSLCTSAGINSMVISLRPEAHWLNPRFFHVNFQELAEEPPELKLEMPGEGNLGESLDHDMAVLEHKLLVLWQSNVEAPLPQIRGRWLNLQAPGTRAATLTPITDHRYVFSHPALTAGKTGFGAVFTGAINGLIRIYFRYIPLTELAP